MESYHQNLVGYACQNMDVEQDVYRTCRIDRFNDEIGHELIAHNLNVLEGMIDYNIAHGLKMFRITSSLIPFASNLQVNTINWRHDFSAQLARIRDKIVTNHIRISVHPGQYTVLNSLNDAVIERSMLELEYHVDILESLGGTTNSKMIIHVGGIFGDKAEAINRFINTCNTRLSERVRRHLIIENDDRLYHVEDVLYIANHTGLPMVFDNLHNACNPGPSNWSEREILRRAFATWTKEDGRPKIHYSQQDENKRMGAHTYTINAETFYHFFQPLQDLSFDIMLEVKDKNRSAIKISVLLSNDFKAAEKEWSRYKYLVLEKSQNAYLEIRNLLKDKEHFSVLGFYKLIDDALLLKEDKGSQINAFEHVWGYFKKQASDKEKNIYKQLLADYKKGTIDRQKVKNYLKKLAIKYHESYLLNSYYFNHEPS